METSPALSHFSYPVDDRGILTDLVGCAPRDEIEAILYPSWSRLSTRLSFGFSVAGDRRGRGSSIGRSEVVIWTVDIENLPRRGRGSERLAIARRVRLE